MKTALKILAITTLAFLISLNGICQLPTVKATSQGWAGGICCRTGVNYVVTLTGSPKSLKDVKVNSVCIDGLKFEASRLNFTAVTNENTATVTIYMSVSHDERHDYVPDEKLKTNEPAACSDMVVNYTTGLIRRSIIIDTVTELEFIAYP